MRRFRHVLCSMAAAVTLSVAYGWLLSRSGAPFAVDLAIWLLFTGMTGGMIFAMAGAIYYYPDIKKEEEQQQQEIIPYETFKANFKSPDAITEELEAIPVWKKQK